MSILDYFPFFSAARGLSVFSSARDSDFPVAAQAIRPSLSSVYWRIAGVEPELRLYIKESSIMCPLAPVFPITPRQQPARYSRPARSPKIKISFFFLFRVIWSFQPPFDRLEFDLCAIIFVPFPVTGSTQYCTPWGTDVPVVAAVAVKVFGVEMPSQTFLSDHATEPCRLD